MLIPFSFWEKVRNKKAQFVGLIFSLIAFLIVYALFIASFVNFVSSNAMATGNYTGISAFFISNLNAVIIVSMIIGVLWLTYMGTQ